jgi:hypothetical protein
MDLGDACNGMTMDDVEKLNGNWATSASILSQPSIGLVQRGGRCLKWSEKIQNTQALASAYQLQLTGIVIYDNILYNDTNYIQEDTNNASYPTWPTQALPDNRNINLMTEENVIDKGSTFLAVYFVPCSYMNFLNQTLLQKTFVRNGTKQSYTQLTFSLSENHFVTSSDPALSSTSYYSNGNTSSSDTDGDGDDDGDDDKRNYIIYSVTAAAVIIVGKVVLDLLVLLKLLTF